MNHMNNNVRLIGRLGMKTAANCADWRRLSHVKRKKAHSKLSEVQNATDFTD